LVASFASARKSATDAYYTTTDDEKFGRGQRNVRKNKHFFKEREKSRGKQ